MSIELNAPPPTAQEGILAPVQERVLYTALNMRIVENVPSNAREILDLGCGSGAMGKYLKAQDGVTGRRVTGVTYSDDEATVAEKDLDRVIVADLNVWEPDVTGVYDCVVCSHVLEHIYQPQLLLQRVKKAMRRDATLLVALPNVVNISQRMEFLRGRFRYTDWGTMDRTHFRFFDWQTAQDLITDAGFQIQRKGAEGYFPLPLVRRGMGKMADKIDAAATRANPNLFAKQFIFVAKMDQD